MVDAGKVTNVAGQQITVFTADQQLYSVFFLYHVSRSQPLDDLCPSVRRNALVNEFH